MFDYKGFIQVTRGRTFYPVSRIKELKPHNDNSFKTDIIFDDGKIVTFDKPIIQTIERINSIRKELNEK